MDEKSSAGEKSESDHYRDLDDEIMVERFFQLVASFREARNRLIRKEAEIIKTRVVVDDVDESKKEKERKRKRTTSSSSSAEEIGINCWRGEFERGDFASDAEVLRVPITRRHREEDATKRQHNEIKRHNDDRVVGRLNLDLTL